MMNLYYILSFFLLVSCSNQNEDSSLAVHSPDEQLKLTFFLTKTNTAAYALEFKQALVVDTSTLGFTFKDFPTLKGDLEIISTKITNIEESWEMPWGEDASVENRYNQLSVSLKEKTENGFSFNLNFKVYNDGIGFRYEFPNQNNLEELVILDEHTEFKLTDDHDVWWIPGDWDIYEHLYNSTKFTEIDALSKVNHPNLAQTYIPENAVNTPVTMRTADGLHLSFHEANLTDYSGMTLKIDKENLSMTSELVGSNRLKAKAKVKLPFHTPWRTIHVAEKAGALIESKLILNLNEPNQLGNVDWFKPKKYVGIWWEMHLGKSSWDLKASQDMSSHTSGEKRKNKHGATTENAKRYIDFAAENNIGGVLVEGWNTGWEHWIGFEDREGVFDFITPYPDYDLEEVVRYANEKGVELIMHHETSSAPRTYEQQLDTAFRLMQRLGIHSVKTGYVGKIIPKGEFHHGQWMVNHYRKVLKTAAKYNIAINAHEPIKATGLRRTYPNAISREGLRGQEFNAWAGDGGNPPEHLSIVAFTRMLSGPIDFTPGVFNIKLDPYKEHNQNNTTLAQQLALYVVIYSPVQMACDLPENYEGQVAFQFIRDVGVDWEKSIVLNGEIGDFVTIARKEKGTKNWFLGSITDENPRTLNIDLSFLDSGVSYLAAIYSDAEDAHWDHNPTKINIDERTVDRTMSMTLKMAAGGGTAIYFKPE